MTVAEGVALFVAHSFEELIDPDGSINGEALAVEGGEVGRPRAGLDDLPETLNTHPDDFTDGSERRIGMRLPIQGKVTSFWPSYEPRAPEKHREEECERP